MHLLSNATPYAWWATACGDQGGEPHRWIWGTPKFPRTRSLSPPASTSDSPALAAQEEHFIMRYGRGADRETAIWEENLDPDSSGDFLSKYFCICKETSFCLHTAVMVIWAKSWQMWKPSVCLCSPPSHRFWSLTFQPSHLAFSSLTAKACKTTHRTPWGQLKKFSPPLFFFKQWLNSQARCVCTARVQ